MKPNLHNAIILPFILIYFHSGFAQTNPYSLIINIPLPDGYSRTSVARNSFTEWLRNLPLKKSKTVYLYNGVAKRNQAAQFAVIDISVGNKDLQQCADAVMRLRAEYLYLQKRFIEISFSDNNHHEYKLNGLIDRKHFNSYLENVFCKMRHIVFGKAAKIYPQNK